MWMPRTPRTLRMLWMLRMLSLMFCGFARWSTRLTSGGLAPWLWKGAPWWIDRLIASLVRARGGIDTSRSMACVGWRFRRVKRPVIPRLGACYMPDVIAELAEARRKTEYSTHGRATAKRPALAACTCIGPLSGGRSTCSCPSESTVARAVSTASARPNLPLANTAPRTAVSVKVG